MCIRDRAVAPPGGRRSGRAGNRSKPLQTGWSAAVQLLLYHRRWLIEAAPVWACQLQAASGAARATD
eukprot:11952266-Alexandrium_andersonii.AAC.1